MNKAALNIGLDPRMSPQVQYYKQLPSQDPNIQSEISTNTNMFNELASQVVRDVFNGGG